MQHHILRDLDWLHEGKGSLIVIDSQGDMIGKIIKLADIKDLSDRLVYINPYDIDHPPALNLFDFGLERLNRYDPIEKEKLINGAIALYEYLFGALLGAELTHRQDVVFRFLARLMMTVPKATIHTLMDFMYEREKVRPYLSKLDPVSQRFFDTQFFTNNFDDTRQRILTRLWGVVEKPALERMFANEKNKVDIFDAMNRGSIILINTAKDLLKQSGTEIFGRFFIALIAQAVQERAAIAENRRKQTFLYIDEAADYFAPGDPTLEQLFSQSRKYCCGLTIAFQSLSQLDTKLRDAITANTAIKMVGGLSTDDASKFAKEMRCHPEFLLNMKKGNDTTQFACFVKNHTPQPVPLTVPLGEMEKRPRLTEAEYDALMKANRQRVSANAPQPPTDRPPSPDGLGPPDML